MKENMFVSMSNRQPGLFSFSDKSVDQNDPKKFTKRINQTGHSYPTKLMIRDYILSIKCMVRCMTRNVRQEEPSDNNNNT